MRDTRVMNQYRWDGGTPDGDRGRMAVMRPPHDAQAASDARLVQALRRGEPGALDVLIERYGDRVYGLAMRITGVKEEAEVATEDALRRVVHDSDAPTTGTKLASRLFQGTARAAHEA